ncbi:hypothetical protein, partial [Trichormus variabilis]
LSISSGLTVFGLRKILRNLRFLIVAISVVRSLTVKVTKLNYLLGSFKTNLDEYIPTIHFFKYAEIYSHFHS